MLESNSHTYARGFLVGSDEGWYHGELTRDEAEQALKVSGCDCFLIRHDQEILVLSLIHDGEFHHITISYGPGWYELENGSARYSFTELEDLVAHYLHSPELAMRLGEVCVRVQGGGKPYNIVTTTMTIN